MKLMFASMALAILAGVFVDYGWRAVYVAAAIHGSAVFMLFYTLIEVSKLIDRRIEILRGFSDGSV